MLCPALPRQSRSVIAAHLQGRLADVADPEAARRVAGGGEAGLRPSRLVPGSHVFARPAKEDVDGRDKPGHDDVDKFATNPKTLSAARPRRPRTPRPAPPARCWRHWPRSYASSPAVRRTT